MKGQSGLFRPLTFGVLAVLAIVPYLPALWQPFISDDYLQIHLARQYGPPAGWGALIDDVLYRSRATSLVLTWCTDRLFGSSSPAPYYATALLLHVLNTWLVFLLGAWNRIGWAPAAVAAGFFAVYLGHQEAVMWYSALPELLLFFFLLSFVLCWIRWVTLGSKAAYAAAVLFAVLALCSKEPGVLAVPLALLIVAVERGGTAKFLSVLPLGGAAGAYAAGIFAAQSHHLHFNDGTFSVHAPFWFTWGNSVRRMLWISGLASLVFLAATRELGRRRKLLALGAGWMAVTVLPYCFLTYMDRIPSRHTYLPSAGLAFVVAAGFIAFRDRFSSRRRWAVPALAGVMLAHQCGYIWIKKRPQFLERAEATESLIELARQSSGPIYVHCFPYGKEIARLALEVGLNKPASMLIWNGSPPREAESVFCPLHGQTRMLRAGAATAPAAHSGRSAGDRGTPPGTD